MTSHPMLYVDHAATTPLWPSAREAMLPFLGERFANASSLYAGAREARKAIEEARESVAAAVGARPEEVVFTSGGTEADNLALIGVARRMRPQGRDGVVVTAVEHHAVLETAAWLGHAGWRVTVVGVDERGVVDLAALEAAVDRRTAIVSVMAANNEVGTVMPLDAVARIAHAAGARFHSDAVQALPWLDIRGIPAGLVALSAHKVGGPKGVGALVVRRGVTLEPLLHGGGQERGIRSGTYNVAGIAGFGEAVRCTLAGLSERAGRVAALRDRLQESLRAAIPGLVVGGDPDARLPNNCHVCIPGVESEPLLLLLDAAGVAASSGSACQSGAAEPSHVLAAMGVPAPLARGALRLTLGEGTTQSDVDAVVERVREAVERLRR